MQERFLLHCDRGARLVPIDSPNEGSLLQQAQLAGLQDGVHGGVHAQLAVGGGNDEY